MKSISKVLKLKANSTEAEIQTTIDQQLTNGYELKAVESFGNDIRIYFIKKI